jgi:hypothetical protein
VSDIGYMGSILVDWLSSIDAFGLQDIVVRNGACWLSSIDVCFYCKITL